MHLVKIKRKYSAAYSLVEIMVAVFITSIISIAVVSLYTTGLRTFFQITETSKQSDESIVLFTMIEKDLSRGGFTHPIRSHVDYCGTKIKFSDAVKIDENVTHDLLGGTVPLTVSSCFDKPTTIAYGDNDIERFKVTYAQGTGQKENILFKKIERTDDCNTLIVSNDKLSDNAKAIIHDWLPVSTNVKSFIPTISEKKPDIVDIEMKLQSQRNPDLMLNFIKRVFVKNQSIYVTSEECEETCPNSIKPFINYQISDDHAFWPLSTNVPGGLIFFQTGYDEKTDELIFPPSPLNPTPIDDELKSDFGPGYKIGPGTGEEYQTLLSSVKYVYKDLVEEPSTKNIALFLYSDTCDFDLTKFYYSQEGLRIYCRKDDGGSITWNASKKEAEDMKYYKLDGKLLSINDVDEKNFIDTTVFRDAWIGWIGGKKTDDVWKWTGEGDVLIEESFVDSIKVFPVDTPGADYLWYSRPSKSGDAEFNASVEDHPMEKYIIEFYAPHGSQFTCQKKNSGGCVNYYSSTTIEIEELNLCHIYN